MVKYWVAIASLEVRSRNQPLTDSDQPMSNISVFDFESHQIRFVDGSPVANDVAIALGYVDPVGTISKKVETENKRVVKMATPRGMQSTTVLEEAGIYQLVFGSKLPSAKKFQKWVFSEVLPSIRKTGSYSVNKSLAPFWWQRLLLDQKTNKVPNGYFSIFREVIPLVAELETAGYVLPDNAVPDISVGKHWANHLKTINIVVEQVAKQYPHTYPDHRGTQPCNCYPETMLPTFRQWFREKYKVDHLQKYMKSKDLTALPAVDRIVKALVSAN